MRACGIRCRCLLEWPNPSSPLVVKACLRYTTVDHIPLWVVCYPTSAASTLVEICALIDPRFEKANTHYVLLTARISSRISSHCYGLLGNKYTDEYAIYYGKCMTYRRKPGDKKIVKQKPQLYNERRFSYVQVEEHNNVIFNLGKQWLPWCKCTKIYLWMFHVAAGCEVRQLGASVKDLRQADVASMLDCNCLRAPKIEW